MFSFVWNVAAIYLIVPVGVISSSSIIVVYVLIICHISELFVTIYSFVAIISPLVAYTSV